MQVRWEADSAGTPMGQLTYFIEFLTLTELWSGWQERCPLSYVSPNAPSKADVLGTWCPVIGATRMSRRFAAMGSEPEVFPHIFQLEQFVMFK